MIGCGRTNRSGTAIDVAFVRAVSICFWISAGNCGGLTGGGVGVIVTLCGVSLSAVGNR